MKTFTFSKEDQQKIVEALENHISNIRLYGKKERNRLRNKTTKNLGRRKNDQMIVDKAEEKIVGIQRIVDEIKKQLGEKPSIRVHIPQENSKQLRFNFDG